MKRDPSRFTGKKFDLLIVGGGIMGAGIAWDAAQRGLSCALIEQGDFGSGTSSKTTKLIHGGIRYLENLEIGLVRQAIRERGTLLRLAPHLVKPLPFLIPVAGSSPRPWPVVRTGVALYDWLARGGGVPAHRVFGRDETSRREPLLAGAAPRAVEYFDAQMDDARLVLSVVQKAVEFGAEAANHCRVAGWRIKQGRVAGVEAEDLAGGGKFTIDATVCVNATGPWVDRVRALADPGARPLVRPSKGVHLVYPGLGLQHALLLSSPRDRRIFFLIPWKELTLIGTTDTDYSGDPGQASAGPDDVEYLIRETNRLLPKLALDRKGVLTTFAGVRPLVAQQKKDPWAVSRAHLLHQDPNGMLSLVGGKFTTFRAVAEESVDRIARLFPGKRLKRCATAESGFGPQYGTWRSDRMRELLKEMIVQSAVYPQEVSRLVQRYGIGAADILEAVRRDREAAAPLCPHHPFMRAEARYAAEHEMALSLSDLLWRRLQAGWSSCLGLDMLPAAAEEMGAALGWSAQEAGRQKERYLEEVQASRRGL